MTDTIYLQFEGLQSPVALEDAAPLMPLISDILARWPHDVLPHAAKSPFVTISPSNENKWALTLAETPASPRYWNAVNVICDLVAEMAWERLRSDPQLLCLHAAAVAFSGRLIVFPNARRAGKSTLTAALAQCGHSVFTDDFLPVRIDEPDHLFHGIANGVAPRIRLPLPKTFSDAVHAWAKQDRGPSNKQYKYLCDTQIAAGGDTMPIGAMIVLDRQDSPRPPSLVPIPREDALACLISQNFARTQVSGKILNDIDALTQHLPVFRLSYHCGEEAARFLSTHALLKDLPAASATSASLHIAQAPLEKLEQPRPTFLPTRQYVQADGLTETRAGLDHFLADGNGLSIYRLNAGSVAIWNVLAEPANLNEVVEILTTAFHDVATDQIATDSEDLMRSLVGANLIVPANADAVAL